MENKDGKTKRIHMLDELRGFAILCMIIHHSFLDIGDVLGFSWGYTVFDALCLVQPIFWAIFIIISGICSRLSRNTIKRGVIVLSFGLVITFFTVVIMPLFGLDGNEIYFGILHCLGCSMIITGILMPLINKINYKLGCIIMLLLFLLTYTVNTRSLLFGLIPLPDVLYANDLFAPLGFYSESFKSADYFSLIPWLFLFLFGAFAGKPVKDGKLPQVMYKKHGKLFSFLGRNSLWVYILHQPILYAIMFAAAFIIVD